MAIPANAATAAIIPDIYSPFTVRCLVETQKVAIIVVFVKNNNLLMDTVSPMFFTLSQYVLI